MKEKNVKKKHGYVFDIHTWKPVINYNMIDFYMGGRKALTISTNQSRKMQELLIDFCIKAGIRFVEFYEPLSVSERRCAYGSN